MTRLLSHSGDPRDFRRFPLRQESGISLIGEATPWHASVACAARHSLRESGNFHSVTVRNISMTGLYFVTRLPYRPGLRMEVRIPLDTQVVSVTGIVRRLDRPATTVEGVLHGAFGCGIDFAYGLMTQTTRRAIMDFLLAQSEPATWNEMPEIRTRFPRPPSPKNA